MAMSMAEFLKIVDVPAKGEDFIDQVVELLAGVGLELQTVIDLDGLSGETMTKALPQGTSIVKISFISRAIKKATLKSALTCVPTTPGHMLPAASTPLGQTVAQDGYEQFVDFFAKKKAAAKKVHVMLGPSLSKVNVSNLAESAWPQGVAMNAAATEAARRSALLVEAGSTVMDEPFVCV